MSLFTPLHGDDHDSLAKFANLISSIVKHRQMMTDYIDEMNELDKNSEFHYSKTNRQLFAKIEKRLQSSRSLAVSFERELRKSERQLELVKNDISDTWAFIESTEVNLGVSNHRRFFRKLFDAHGGFLEPINEDFMSGLQQGAHDYAAALCELCDLAKSKSIDWKATRKTIVNAMLAYRRLSYESHHSRQFADLGGWDDDLSAKAKHLRKMISKMKK